ncbi:DNA primase family protein [Desulfatibacillum aliphaticivorans]|uniref:DNA primase family protein n=1 Tax=Desulfatibacillum aliphaticivorans TaxID=218208 RepID=UPI000409FFC1|nr:phage/plasmid primase, P4 family [Desulfatibacillum aliphaticivorans]
MNKRLDFELLVRVDNGVVDLRDAGLYSDVVEDVSDLPVLDVAYKPDAACPRWKQFLEEIFPDNPVKADFLQGFMGYCLMRMCNYQTALILFGDGANGKSTVLKVLSGIFGRENCCSVSLPDLQVGFNIPFLKDKMVNLVSGDPIRWNLNATPVFKSAVSGQVMEGAVKYGSRVSFRPFAKHIFAMNTPPAIADSSYAFQRRFVVLNFPRRFRREERDINLFEQLMREKEGIFAWIVAGAYSLLLAGGFGDVIDEQIKGETKDFFDAAGVGSGKRVLGPLMVEEYLRHYGRELTGIKSDGNKTSYLLKECVFDSSHRDGEAAIVSSPNKPFLTYHCFHDACDGRTWKDAREVISGSEKLARFCEGYDPNWKPERQSRKKAPESAVLGGYLVRDEDGAIHCYEGYPPHKDMEEGCWLKSQFSSELPVPDPESFSFVQWGDPDPTPTTITIEADPK